MKRTLLLAPLALVAGMIAAPEVQAGSTGVSVSVGKGHVARTVSRMAGCNPSGPFDAHGNYRGDNDDIFVTQGRGNRAVVRQQGNNHRAGVRQHGKDQCNLVIQTGRGTSANVNQHGNGTTGLTVIHGN
ncbi:hypothetical protein [Roseovarius salinarum]|uniref:hypothetical protein n=1 Tax=Roseovarius salinarum TaxID=1981892 RepID=UPI000C33BE35|nr:hypothetical protein [Roseovarius salinarum]